MEVTCVGCVDQTVVACSATVSSLNQAPKGQKILRLCLSSRRVNVIFRPVFYVRTFLINSSGRVLKGFNIEL